MRFSVVPGTEGYAEEACDLLQRYENLRFEDVHSSIQHLIPSSACHVLDIGSGTGRDAAAFAAKGHHVVAIEPTKELRIPAMVLHPSPAISWVDDSLPELAIIRSRGVAFDLVFLSAVWMHLDELQRKLAMANVSSLMAAGATLIILLRHGPVPAGRRMFEVAATETIELAAMHGMVCVLDVAELSRQGINRQAGVTWSRLAFVKSHATE